MSGLFVTRVCYVYFYIYLAEDACAVMIDQKGNKQIDYIEIIIVVISKRTTMDGRENLLITMDSEETTNEG